MKTSTVLKTITCASALMIMSLPALGGTTATISAKHTVAATRDFTSGTETLSHFDSSNSFSITFSDNDVDGFEVTAVSANGHLQIAGSDQTSKKIDYSMSCEAISDAGGNTVTATDIDFTTSAQTIYKVEGSSNYPIDAANPTCTISNNESVNIATKKFEGAYVDTITWTIGDPAAGV